jgi:hypothetical protein
MVENQMVIKRRRRQRREQVQEKVKENSFKKKVNSQWG